MTNEDIMIKIDGKLRQNEQDAARKAFYQQIACKTMRLISSNWIMEICCVYGLAVRKKEFLISLSICQGSSKEVINGRRL